MVFLGYKNNLGDLMKRENCSWIEWISHRHANPSQQTHAVQLCDLFVLYFYFTHWMLVVSALYYWSDIQLGAAFARAIEECALPAQYNIWQDNSFFFWGEAFYFITSYENNRIITLTLNRSTSHLTADTSQALVLYLTCIWVRWSDSVNSFRALLLK